MPSSFSRPEFFLATLTFFLSQGNFNIIGKKMHGGINRENGESFWFSFVRKKKFLRKKEVKMSRSLYGVHSTHTIKHTKIAIDALHIHIYFDGLLSLASNNILQCT